MSFHNLDLPADGSVSPLSWYRSIAAIPGFVRDEAQAAAIAELESLWQQLIAFKARRNGFLGRSLLSPEVPKGLYLWGGVGRGKTLLMDVFYASLPYRRKRRIHFHAFMAEVHQQLKRLDGEADPLRELAQRIADATRLLCLDEFHVEDIADAMILGRLLEALLKDGVVVITTSNQPPDKLYEHGLQRQNFLPAIQLLNKEMKVLNVDGGSDYRTLSMAREPLFLVPADDGSEVRMDALFDRIAAGLQRQSGVVEINGRNIAVKQQARGAAWFEFDELCGGAHAQEDYLELAQRYATLFLSGIPLLTPERAAEMRRLVWLIDVLYDHNVRLVASADAMPESLCADHTEFARTASRLIEMQSRDYLQRVHRAQGTTLT